MDRLAVKLLVKLVKAHFGHLQTKFVLTQRIVLASLLDTTFISCQLTSLPVGDRISPVTFATTMAFVLPTVSLLALKSKTGLSVLPEL